MKRPTLKDLTIHELVDCFVAVALEQEQAELMGDTNKYSPLCWKLDAVRKELRERKGDQRRALLPLLGHPNFQVRLKAAKSTLALSPVAARKALEEIAQSQHFPQAGEAGMSLWNLDRGVFKPT